MISFSHFSQAARGRGARRAAGRARRSADDQEGEEGQTAASYVGQVVEGVKNLVLGESATTTGTETAGRGGKAKRGRGAARAPRVKKERGEPSKTVSSLSHFILLLSVPETKASSSRADLLFDCPSKLVFIRNLPFSYTEEEVGTLFSSNNLTYASLSMPLWKYGPRKGKGRGYAFATVSSEEEQKKAIETLNGKEIATGEMFTPRKPAAVEGETPAEGAEAVADPEPTERILKLVARQGFENEEKDTADAHDARDEASAAAATNGNGKFTLRTYSSMIM